MITTEAAIREQIAGWMMEYEEKKSRLRDIGSSTNGAEYNCTSAEAMRLLECINDLLILIDRLPER